MKTAIITFVLSAVVIALPQAPAAQYPPTATSPKVPGQFPKGGINPFQSFGQLASQLGFDPAKATPDPKG